MYWPLPQSGAGVARRASGRPRRRHSRAEERIAVEDVARQLGAAFSGLWLKAPLSVRLDRVGHRERDASDANVAVAAAQASSPSGAMTWRPLDASGNSSATFEAARALLGLPPPPDRSTERVRHRGAAPSQ